MNKRQKFASFSGIGAVGAAALLLGGCGGNSFQKNTFGNYANTLPAAYGIEPSAASSNLQATPTFFETSGLGSSDSKTAYLTAATDFSVLKNPDNSTIAINADPNGTGKIPLGFSLGGFYIDQGAGSATAIAATTVPTGTSTVFRAALANGVSTNNTPPISANGVTLSSTDAQWTLGTLPMIFNNPGAGPLSNGTYVTGTGTTPTPFTLPFTSSGIHTVIVTVTDDAGRQTATTFGVPVLAAGNVALLAQNITADGQTGTPAATAIAAKDTVTIDGASGVGTYPAGYSATTADAQGTVVFFVAPGTHTLVDTTQSLTQTITIPAAAAGTTIIQ